MKKKDIIYLDYSATTKPDEVVIKRLNYIVKNYYANPNSKHLLGIKAKQLIDKSIKNICNYFNVSAEEIIFTSGASEANNMAIKGIIGNNNLKKHIITTKFEHASVFGPISYLQNIGYKIDFVNLKKDGTVDLNHLKSLITDDTLLVTICAIDSEIGIIQPIKEIGLLLKNYSNVYFHSDITQCVGKYKIDLTYVDLASFSGHKIFCFKGIGGLIKKKHVKLLPLIHGGKSITSLRSGTPQTELIVSLSEAFNLFKDTVKVKYDYVYSLNLFLKKELLQINGIYINSNDKCIPNILNISILNKNSSKTQKYLEKHNIFVSTKTACATNNDLSLSVLTLTNDEKKAASSIRISLSFKTTKEELKQLVKILKIYKENKNEIS